MLLVIDVGNTNIVLGLYDGEQLMFDWRIATDKSKTSDEYGMLFRQVFAFSKFDINEVKDVIISSVVPNLMHTIPGACERYIGCRPMVVDSDTDTGIINAYANPKEVGADRIVNAVAGFYKYHGPLIIVDIGTAITFDVITEKGEYLGGAIAPGIGISAEALFLRTAKLPKVELKHPKSVVGRTTKESIQSGLVFGYIGLMDRLIEQIVEEKNWKEYQVIGTGGYSTLIAQHSKYITKVDKLLTLEGLRLIHQRNQEKKHGSKR